MNRLLVPHRSPYERIPSPMIGPLYLIASPPLFASFLEVGRTIGLPETGKIEVCYFQVPKKVIFWDISEQSSKPVLVIREQI